MPYVWLIYSDLVGDPVNHLPGTNCNAVGMIGPVGADPKIVKLLQDGHGTEFRLFRKTTGQLCYAGRLIGDVNGPQPLDDFGRAQAGCDTIIYMTTMVADAPVH